MQAGRYRDVLRRPGVKAVLAASLMARLPAGMASLAIILRISGGTGSYAGGGAVTAAYVAGASMAGPLLGRAADRIGRRPVLLASAVANASGLIILSRIPVHQTLTLLFVAALSGASTPPVTASVRSLWPRLVPAAARDAAYGLDATFQELVFIAGPALVALLGSVAGPSAALAASGLLGLAGTTALAVQPALGTPPVRAQPGQRRLRSSGLVAVIELVVAMVIGFGIVEVGVVGFAGASHASHQAGLLLATWSIGSLSGGLAFGARVTAGGARLLGPILAFIAAGFAALALAPDVPWLYVLLFISGTALAPGLGCVYGVTSRLVPSGSAVEAFSWLASALQFGMAAGAAAGGLAVQDLGARAAFLVGAGCVLAAASWALVWGHHLSSRPGLRLSEVEAA
jgi:MFS family permease